MRTRGLILMSLLFALSARAENRIKVAVIDTGIAPTNYIKPYLCSDSYDVSGHGVRDITGHGTNIAHIISKGIDNTKYCLMIVKWFHDGSAGGEESIRLNIKAINLAIKNGARYINASLSGTGSDSGEQVVYRKALRLGIQVVVSAGNNGLNLNRKCEAYPACYAFKKSNFHVIGGLKKNSIAYDLNWGGPVTDYENADKVEGGGITLSGTSQAAAVYTNKLLKRGDL